MQGQLFIVAAPSGAGKTSLVREVANISKSVDVSVSHTTRSQRAGEEQGVDYHFISEDVFLDMVKKEQFLEYAKVFQHYYGTSKAWLTEQLEMGRDIILEIDWQGAQQVKKQFPEHATSIFIFPPSLAILESRLRGRDRDDESVIEHRMSEARAEMAHYAEFDYLIVNDDFVHASKELSAIMVAKNCSISRQKGQNEELIRDLLKG